MQDHAKEIDENKQEFETSLPPLSDSGIQSIQGENSSLNEGDWEDLGIQDVPVNQVDLSDSPVNGDEDFRKVSREEMVEGFSKLESEIRPAVTNGAEGDYFTKLDQERGLDYEHGYKRVYDAFYGDTSIKLDKINDNYTVVNGYHRLAVAKELGLATVTARVT